MEKLLFGLFGTILAAGFAAFLGFTLWGFRKAFYMPEKKKHTNPYRFLGEERDLFCKEPMLALVKKLDSRPFEWVSITSRDGLVLKGRFYEVPHSDVVEILFHGWRGNALRDGCGGADLALRAGHSLLLVDQRAHGESQGHIITFGIKEKYDCLEWVTYLDRRFGGKRKILLSGVSMGAATVLMASDLELPPSVKGIMADCGYSTPEAIMRKVCRDMGISDRLGFPVLRLSAALLGGFSLRDGGAVEAVKHAKVPILIIHGTQDNFVPHAMCREIFDACTSEKYLLEVPEAGHGLSFLYDETSYTRAVDDFCKNVL